MSGKSAGVPVIPSMFRPPNKSPPRHGGDRDKAQQSAEDEKAIRPEDGRSHEPGQQGTDRPCQLFKNPSQGEDSPLKMGRNHLLYGMTLITIPDAKYQEKKFSAFR